VADNSDGSFVAVTTAVHSGDSQDANRWNGSPLHVKRVAAPRSGVLGAATMDLTPKLGANGNGNSKVNCQAFHGQAIHGQAFDEGKDNEPQVQVERKAIDEETRSVTVVTRHGPFEYNEKGRT
jgi:hypothetical protein